MWADLLTKPKQGKKFRLCRSKLLNVPVELKMKKGRTKNVSEITGVLGGGEVENEKSKGVHFINI